MFAFNFITQSRLISANLANYISHNMLYTRNSPQISRPEGNTFVGESDASSEAVCKIIRRLAGLPGELRGQASRLTFLL